MAVHPIVIASIHNRIPGVIKCRECEKQMNPTSPEGNTRYEARRIDGGGDCPGLNAVIRAVTASNFHRGSHTLGIRRGWRGLVEGDFVEITGPMISGILDKGGTILGSSRTNPTKDPAMLEQLKDNWRASRIDGLIAIGGDDTLSVAAFLNKEGMNVISVPKTIDNDIGFTGLLVRLPHAVGVITDAIDRLRTTAEAHDRVIILEVMGRHSGWLATYAGIAGGADLILVPERPFDIEEVVSVLKARFARGRNFANVVVAEARSPRE